MRPDPYRDAEVRALVDWRGRTATFDEIRAACVDRFGPERAWSRTKIGRYWDSIDQNGKGRALRIERDRELRDLVDAMAGHFSGDQIGAACKAQLGKVRAPSRTAIYRYIGKMRRERMASLRKHPPRLPQKAYRVCDREPKDSPFAAFRRMRRELRRQTPFNFDTAR